MKSIILPLVLVAASVALAVPAALAKPFWHDEIYTILLSSLPVRTMWQAALDGVDLSPPLNLWLTRATHSLAGVGPLATRLPAFIGFVLSVVVIFRLLLRRVGLAGALAGALIPFLTAALRYSYEARAYGVMMGCAAVTLYCWMEAAAGRRRRRNLSLLALALGASIWNHYYGVLVFAPVAVGEVSRWMQARRIDWGVIAAAAAALVTAIPLYPLVAAAASQRGTFWAPATLASPGETYRYILNAMLEPAFSVGAGVTVALLGLGALLRRGRPGDERRLHTHEVAAVATAAVIPLLALALGKYGTGVFVPRYALSAVPGLSVLVPLLVWRLNVRRTPAELVLCATLVYVVGSGVITSLRQPLPHPADPVAGRSVFLKSLRSPGPTVVSSSLQFAQLWYYTPPDLQPRLRYLADPDQALERMGADTIDRGYLALASRRRVPVEPYLQFVAQYPDFRVYEAGSGWLLETLAESGASVEEIANEPGGRLYQVRMPDRPRP